MNIFGDLRPYAGKEKTKRPERRANPAAEAGSERAAIDHAAILDGLISSLWLLKLDTAAIAAKLELAESLVANRLAAIRDARCA